MIVILVLIAALAVVPVAIFAHLVIRRGLSTSQALLYLPFKLTHRIRDRDIRLARDAQAPVIYVISHQSKLDPALMLCLLPEDTLHILDPESAQAEWLSPWRKLARTIAFNAEHVFVSRRLVRVLKGKGRIAVYVPDEVEPDVKAFRLYRAVGRIAQAADARIVPIVIDGARHSRWSLADTKDAPRRTAPALTVGVLPAQTVAELIAASGPAAGTASNVLFDRLAEARAATAHRGETLFSALRGAARDFGADARILQDAGGEPMTYRRMLMAARILAGRFARMTAPGDVVGLLLPTATPTALALAGLASAGRIGALMNYTAGPANITASVRTTTMRIVLSSRRFVEKADLGATVEAAQAGGARVVWVEDLLAGITRFDKAIAALAWRGPVGRSRAADAAVIVFTSGSTGAPRAVVLSHANLVANAMQVRARLDVGPGDLLMNVLPLFHCFGLTGGLVLPLLAGVPVVLYPSPLHYKLIPKVARKVRPTILFATDTFLAAYARTAADGDFSSLRFAVAGAEPLREETRRVWKERFGVRLLEGYGMTEAAPVVALNTAAHARDGTVGRLLPGMRLRLEPVEGIANGGRMHVSGPNIMVATMSEERPGVAIPVAGDWHDMGDIVSLDREGYITIRGRARRFAKIAGEMVSLAAVEALAAATWPAARHAAVALPDARRGERIVLLTTVEEPEAGDLRRTARDAGAPEIALPQDILTVDEIPILGTGKTDYADVRRIAAERGGSAAAA
jgi:acyl-[acyl-carrier-protein]-phospholipid O-acyltransferase/long-chain-fatty-acid--[acyl-carrier-protein] ligase